MTLIKAIDETFIGALRCRNIELSARAFLGLDAFDPNAEYRHMIVAVLLKEMSFNRKMILTSSTRALSFFNFIYGFHSICPLLLQCP